LKVGCVEEQAYLKKYIDDSQLRQLASQLHNNYGHYLLSLLDE